ncbi:hypothetical protein ES319_D05G190200v1 [Gossypium barbadense]|uniref:Neutral ceramidase n=1 Tax=Gossypium barbadense TaxID=3634 RepID=A0A5J5RFE3_GOSBA|nr:hypothetical protein ES319_D05G190200v1 [Gossypium barbadense]
MHKHQHLLPIFVALCAAFALIDEVDGEYLIGVGSYDMTEYGRNPFRLRARTFIVAESSQGARFAFVNLDAGMASQLVTIKVLQRLKTRFGDLYTQENLAISGTHTHAGPAGYLQYVVYSVTSLGFINQTFDAIVTAIEQSIIQAHNNLKPGSILLNTGDVENAGINRSPSAYLFNPPEERARYTTNVDTTMTLLKLLDSASNRSIGAFSWFATHGTSMSRENRLISGDNKGAAARFFEDWFTFSNNSLSTRNTKFSTIQNNDKKREHSMHCLIDIVLAFDNIFVQGFKVRKNDGSRFVGAFCQSNVGDVTPNVLGAFCTDTGKPCDFNHSSCNGNDQLCVGVALDEILSTKIIGERQFEKAMELFSSATNPLSGKIDYRHTCPAAVGAGFAAGTTDGPGVFGFQQGDTEINEMWKRLRDLLKEPSQYQVDCQKPKPVLLSTGEMFVPYAWAPAILPIQILRLGNFVILSVPGEFTTMAGRRLREATHVVMAGLTNTYSQYIATFEEYKQQRYEAASTLYGPHTLSAYIQEFKKLAKAMATGEQLDPLGDSPPPGKRFGDMLQDVAQPKGGSFKKGDKPSATFWSANPRYDLLIEGTFAVVEMLQGERWVPVYDDDDFCLYFKWNVTVDNGSLYGLATIEWEVPEDAASGVYRLRHFGSSKKTKDSPNEFFTGASSAFTVS